MDLHQQLAVRYLVRQWVSPLYVWHTEDTRTMPNGR